MMKFLHQNFLRLVLFGIFFMTTGISWGQSIWTNPIDDSAPATSNPYTIGDVKNANITVSGIGRGSGLSPNAGGSRYNATGWTTVAAIDLNDYFGFTLTPNAGNKINFVSLVFTLQRSNTGPVTFVVRSSLDNFASNIQTITGSGTGAVGQTITLSGASFQNIAAAITFRVYGYFAGGATGTASINDFTFNGTVVSAAVAPTITSSLTDSSVYNTGDTYTITASGSPTSYSATPLPTGASLAGNIITFSATVPAAVYNITIQATNGTGSDSKTLVYTRSKASQTITFNPNPLPAKTVGDAPFALSATANSGLDVTYNSSNPAVATISDNIITITGAGSSTITASQAGNANYLAASDVTRTLNVTAAPTLVIAPLSMSLTAIENQGPSAASQLTHITGSNISPASGSLAVAVTQGTAFEVSNVSNSGFGSATTFSYSGANFDISNPAIFVRLKGGLAMGSYTGEVTISVGSATATLTLTGEVESAPSITLTDVTPSGPFCNAVSNATSVTFTTQGTFSGFFTVQLSDAVGVFPDNSFDNIIGAGNSPITSTLPAGLAAGNYKVRVINNAAVNTFSNANSNAIVVNANPSLSGVNTAPVCSGTNSVISLSGLLPDSIFSVNYTINGGPVQEITGITADASGNAGFEVAVTAANDGEQLVVTGLTRTDVTPSCVKVVTFPVALSVNQLPTLTGAMATPVCESESTIVTLSGMPASITAEITYDIAGGSPINVPVTSDTIGTAQFSLLLDASVNGESLNITAITNTGSTPYCTVAISGVSTALNISSRPAAAISADNTLCLGNTAQVTITLTGVQPWSLTYTDGSTPVTVNDITVSPYVFSVAPIQTTTYSVINLSDANCIAQPSDISGSAMITVNANIWTGASDANWENPLNWACNIVPTLSTPVGITAAPTNQPVISGTDSANAKNLDIDAGATLVVATGSTLTVQDIVDVHPGGTFTLQDNANLLQANDGANSGVAIVNKNSVPLFRNDYILWASPVSGQNLLDFSPVTLANRFYTYTTVTDAYTAVTNPQTTAFDLGKGYLIRMPNAGSPSYNLGTETMLYNGAFTGTLNNGAVPLALSTLGQGYNAVGNPYPSTLNFVAFIDANIANNDIEGQIWLWRKTNNSANSSYATMTKAAYAKNDAAGGGVDNTAIDPDTYELNVGQGFIVKSNTGNLIFNNSMRGITHGNPVFRSAAQQKSRYWLNLVSADGGFSQIAVAYREDATLNYDNGLDGKKFLSGNTSLYSFADNIHLAVQARPLFEVNDVVPLGFELATAGEYTIAIDNFEGLFDTQDIFLKDNLTNTIQNIKGGSYTFTADAGSYNDRFEVVYVNTTLSVAVPPVDANNIIVYKDHDVLKINAGKIEMAQVAVYDVRGRLVYSQSGINSTEAVINALPLAQEVLIVKITTSDNLILSKKIIY